MGSVLTFDTILQKLRAEIPMTACRLYFPGGRKLTLFFVA
jgi:hypothetical protein